jgi:hypothetical protein
LFLCRPTATTPASTSKHPIAISPIANGIIHVPMSGSRARWMRRFGDSKSDDQEEMASPSDGPIDLRLFDKILSTIERKF